MGHFYGNVVLPDTVNTVDEGAVVESVRSILQPHEPMPDECFPFSFYFIVDKAWYSGIGDIEADFPQALSGSDLVIVPVRTLLTRGEPHAFITPDSTWYQSGTTYTTIDVGWPQRFRGLAETYKDCWSAAVYFKC